MRLHALSVTAFGPFADTVEVDFDSLSDAGLFLLCGPTGAGKSSILDAVCFALYGEVPGDRSSARRLRCDTAAPGVAPRVQLDLSLGGRRFHLTRSPAWQRPKKRGQGTTPQQASILVQEVVDGRAEHLTNRLDEAGHLITGLLGMNLPQFTQVAMLPQGRFQDFLRARSEDRHALLQKLFRTRRFEDVERWLRDRRIAFRRESEIHCDQITALVHRLDEVGGSSFAVEVDDTVITDGAEDGSLGEWASRTAESASAAVRSARAGLTVSATAATGSAERLEAGRDCAERQGRHSRALTELERLDKDLAAVTSRRGAAGRARQAAPVAGVHQQLLRARTRFEQAEATTSRLLGDGANVEGLTSAEARSRDGAAQARAMLPVEAEKCSLTREITGLELHAADLDRRLSAVRSELSLLPATVARATGTLEGARSATLALQHTSARLAALEGFSAALQRVSEVSVRLVDARDLLHSAVDAHQLAREEWLELHERRLNGMAAEMALALAVGDSCPVCGSSDHPHPAIPTRNAPSAAAEKAARARADDADVVRQAHHDQVRSLETMLAVAQSQSGGSEPGALAAELAAARSDVARLQGLADGFDDAVSAQEAALLVQQQAEATLALVGNDRVAVATSLASARDRLIVVEQALATTLGEHPDLAAVIRVHEQDAAALTAALDALRARDAARAHLSEAASDLDRIARESGFAHHEEAVAALLPVAALESLEAALRDHDAARLTAMSVAEDPDLLAASVLPAPELAALEAAQVEAAEALAVAESTHRHAVETAGRVEALRTQLFDALAAWAPVRESHAMAARVASFAEGKSGDNRAQMRLSAYVLSWRLGQVVDAANARLCGMTDQRYALEHTAHRGAGETRGGLSLVVRDDWSGETRDPVTLSGGETFVVSLALALGLTDVVTQEAGGADIATLFVDEGFGSLDADTLDDVMDTLDSLRDGGRVVGIVSHVPELRTRIPAQLQIDKSRAGSSVRQLHQLS